MADERLAIVIPTLDEGAAVEAAVAAALPHADEIVVSDGGGDGEVERRVRALGARFVTGAAGRGGQLDRGVAATDADWLLFLHADTRLPEGAGDLVRRELAAGADGGGFLVRWDSPRPIYRVGEGVVNWRTRRLRTPLGDQAQFCTRAAFAAVGGFRGLPILEDLDFIRRLGRQRRIAILPVAVETSARRFETGGFLRTIARNWLIFALYYLGVPPARLARLYAKPG